MVDVIRVLHVDDESDFAEVTARHLEREHDDVEVSVATDAERGLQRLQRGSFDCVVSDYDMPEMDGLELLEAVREYDADLPFILFTGKGSEGIASEAISRGVTDYLEKQTGSDQFTVLANRIDNAVTQYRAEQAVERTRERFQKLVEGSTDAISIVDVDGTFEYVAPSIERVLGYDVETLAGTNALDLVHPDDRECATGKLAELSDQPGGQMSADIRVEHADGSVRTVEAKGRNLTHEPAVDGIVLNVRDVTERVELEDRLRATTETLTRLYEVSSDATLDFEMKLTRLLEIGADHLDLDVGYVGSLEGDTLRAIAATGDHERIEPGSEAPLSRTYCRHVVDAVEPVVVTDAEAEGLGDDPAFEAFGLACYLGAPIVVGEEVYGTVCLADPEPRTEPFTETERSLVNLLAHWASYELHQQRRQADLEEMKSWLELALDASDEILWDWDVESGDVHRHDSYERLLGLDPEEMGTDLETFLERIHPDYREEVESAYRAATELGEPYSVEYPIRTADGEYLWVEDKCTVLTDDGEPTRLVGTISDITEHKEREQKLRHQNERLEDFASVVSHDLRNPLQVAQGYIGQVEGNERAVQKVEESLERMNQIIEDMLTMARQGKRVEETEAVDLGVLARECWEHVDTDGATMHVETDSLVQADRNRLRNLLENLFRNAVEHVGEGVTVTVGDTEAGFYVEDDGPGIPEDEREEVFDPGYTTDSQGTGFGLNIVEDIAEAHGWRVDITDGSDGGARFEFTTVAE